MDRVVYGQSVELAFTENVFTNSFQVVTSLGLLCTRDLINYHWEIFHQIVLRLNMPKINYLGLDPEYETNTGYWVVEPSYLLASHRLILCWP